jgi:hypothetical protein
MALVTGVAVIPVEVTTGAVPIVVGAGVVVVVVVVVGVEGGGV